ncbi:hypothetical protein [Yellowstone lake mimivirus]|uniref:hypothetical protein n=1 Tax=Yellowstone lake mimivirus TaxID=1586712 RepID=UPI0006EBC399|nr:hypothetical protein AR680_gp008 [Yellowstone lake mimivirus]BAT21932.1 hypothetical protein [Yellowstone lake mimivirus]
MDSSGAGAGFCDSSCADPGPDETAKSDNRNGDGVCDIYSGESLNSGESFNSDESFNSGSDAGDGMSIPSSSAN